jgi:hypothetical protein
LLIEIGVGGRVLLCLFNAERFESRKRTRMAQANCSGQKELNRTVLSTIPESLVRRCADGF